MNISLLGLYERAIVSNSLEELLKLDPIPEDESKCDLKHLLLKQIGKLPPTESCELISAAFEKKIIYRKDIDFLDKSLFAHPTYVLWLLTQINHEKAREYRKCNNGKYTTILDHYLRRTYVKHELSSSDETVLYMIETIGIDPLFGINPTSGLDPIMCRPYRSTVELCIEYGYINSLKHLGSMGFTT